jgi:hypothetical protein
VHVVVLEQDDAPAEAVAVGAAIDLLGERLAIASAGWAFPANTSCTGRSASFMIAASRRRSRKISGARL